MVNVIINWDICRIWTPTLYYFAVSFCSRPSPKLSRLACSWIQSGDLRHAGAAVSEQGSTSPTTQYRLSGRQFYRSKDPTNSIKVLTEKRYKSKETPKNQTTQNTAKQ